MGKRSWWAASALVSAALAGIIGLLWAHAVSDYAPPPGQLADEASVQAFLGRGPVVDGRILIPTGVFVQSLHFVTASDVNITGYVWQKYADSVPREISRGFTVPEQVSSASTVIEEAYRRRIEDGVVIGWYFDVTVRQPFDYSRYPLDRHHVWLRLWHADFDRNVVLTPDLSAYDSTAVGKAFGLDQEIVPGGWKINETLFEYKVLGYDTNFGIGDYVGQTGFPELYFTVVVSRSFVGAFVTTLVPLLVVAMLLFAVLMMTTADPERANAFGFNTAGAIATASALFFVVMLAHIQLREQFASARIVYLELFYFTTYLAILGVTVNQYIFATGGGGRLVALVRHRDNLVAKASFWPAILLVLALITLGYFAF